MLCIPLIFYHYPVPAFGAIHLYLLDVGQGLSAVIQTQNHTLIFDTGPPIGRFDDNGKRVILPFLNAIGVKKIDKVIISHGDSGHIGGLHSVQQAFPRAEIISSVPEKFARASLCQQGQSWVWDGVKFEFLYPTRELLHLNNNSSCVLKIGNGERAILLTGDIEKVAENYLVENQSANLKSQLLIAPHHGSSTSSSIQFIRAVNPHYVLFPTGYQNRFHFPNDEVVKRYRQMAAVMFDTAETGSIKIEIDKDGNVMNIDEYRKTHWKFWYKE